MTALRKFITGLCLTAALASVGTAQVAVPERLQPPKGEALIARVHARGFQIYTCKADGPRYTWVLKAPDAELFDESGRKVGRHFAGPTWEWIDGSQVMGKVAAAIPSPEASSVPWLLLTARDHAGEGELAHVTSVQRVHTNGGKAPAEGCDAAHLGRETRVAYTADYFFYGK